MLVDIDYCDILQVRDKWIIYMFCYMNYRGFKMGKK